MSISIYQLLSSTGDTVNLLVPRFEGDTRLPGNYNLYTIVSATADLPTQFDHTATFFVRDAEIYNNLTSQGFPNVIYTADHAGETWTFQNGAYIAFTSTSASLRIPMEGGTETAVSLTSRNVARTCISDLANTWLSGVVGYYGELRSITALGFTFNNYYPQNSINQETFDALWDGNTPLTPPTDPYDGAGDSTTGGGGGTYDGSSDPVDIPSLPSVGATNTGFISLFVPTETQIRSVANYLWSSLFDVSTFFKIFENPMDCILGLAVVPVTVPTSGNAQITVGNIELSGITLPLASSQYVEVDCGTISFTDDSPNKFFGSYLDYEPYTKIAIFLPYCGVHQLNADDVMGKSVRVVYHVDILTGSCVAFVKCGDSVLYQFNGACATNIPITNISYNSTIENAIRIAVNIGTTVATAGASAPLSAGAETVGHTAQNVARGVSLAGSTAEGALSLKPSIGRSGALGGTTGIMAGQIPYLIITRPRLCKPKNQNFYKGYPSFVQTTIGDLIGKGYTEFDTVIISTLYLTDNEEAELERILQGGVYL